MCCRVMHCTALCCTVFQWKCVTVWCSVLQYVAVCCSLLGLLQVLCVFVLCVSVSLFYVFQHHGFQCVCRNRKTTEYQKMPSFPVENRNLLNWILTTNNLLVQGPTSTDRLSRPHFSFFLCGTNPDLVTEDSRNWPGTSLLISVPASGGQDTLDQ